jgi:TonB family protein
MLADSKLQLTLVIGLSLASVAVSPSSANRPPVPKAELTVYAPNPEYPPEARQARIAGNGWFRLDFTKTGRVTQVRVLRSTGNRLLDAAAVQTLLHWRFKPGLKVHCVTLPITFWP